MTLAARIDFAVTAIFVTLPLGVWSLEIKILDSIVTPVFISEIYLMPWWNLTIMSFPDQSIERSLCLHRDVIAISVEIEEFPSVLHRFRSSRPSRFVEAVTRAVLHLPSIDVGFSDDAAVATLLAGDLRP